MCRIDHVGLYASDLEGVKDFFIRYFGASSSEMYRNPRTDFRSYFLSFADGARLEVMTRPEVTPSGKSLYGAGFIHLSICVGGKENVDSLSKRLNQDGYQILSGPRTTGDGYYECSILGPEGNQIEITE